MELFHIEFTVRAIKARDICQKYNSPDTYDNTVSERLCLICSESGKAQLCACVASGTKLKTEKKEEEQKKTAANMMMAVICTYKA